MIRRPPEIQIASPSTLLSEPRRERMKRMTTSSALTTRVWSRRVTPPPGAVWPARVIWPLLIFSALQLDRAGHVEHHRARALGLDRRAQAARTGIVEIGDVEHRAAPAAGS
jgi:hypothetical protein